MGKVGKWAFIVYDLGTHSSRYGDKIFNMGRCNGLSVQQYRCFYKYFPFINQVLNQIIFIKNIKKLLIVF